MKNEFPITARHKLVFRNGRMRLEHDKSDYEHIIGPWSSAVDRVDDIILVRPHNQKRNILVIEYQGGLTMLVKIEKHTMDLKPYHQKGGIEWLGG